MRFFADNYKYEFISQEIQRIQTLQETAACFSPLRLANARIKYLNQLLQENNGPVQNVEVGDVMFGQ